MNRVIVEIINENISKRIAGGSNWSSAVDEFVKSLDGKTILVKKSMWDKSRMQRYLRIITIVLEIIKMKPNEIFLRYPFGYPFFFSQDRNRNLIKTILFTIQLIVLKRIIGFKVIIPVGDLLVYKKVSIFFKASPKLLNLLEYLIFRYLASEIWVTSKSIGLFLQDKFNRSPSDIKVNYNGNFRSNLSNSNQIELKNKFKDLIDASSKKDIIFVHFGNLSRYVFNTKIMEAFASGTAKNAWLFIAGPNADWLMNNTLGERVKYLGAISDPNILTYLAKLADVGILYYSLKNEYFNIIFPAKLGFYINCGLMMLTTELKEVKEFVEENKIGIIYNEDNLKNKIEWLINHPEEIKRYKEASSKLSNKFYWDELFRKCYSGEGNK